MITPNHTPEQWAEFMCDRLLSISKTAPEAIQHQARMFRAELKQEFIMLVQQIVLSDRTELAAKLRRSGHQKLAEFVQDI